MDIHQVYTTKLREFGELMDLVRVCKDSKQKKLLKKQFYAKSAEISKFTEEHPELQSPDKIVEAQE